LRRDGFGGEIDVTVEGLPAGVLPAPLKLASGVNSGLLILSASEDASGWTGPLRIVGTHKEIKRHARAGAILANVADYSNEAVFGQLTHELVLNLSADELAPLAIRSASEKPVEAIVDGKVSVPLTIVRRTEFNGPLKFRSLLEPAKEFDADGKATNAVFEIDLKQAKLGPGLHHFPVYATSPGKYRRITPEEAKAFEAEIKTLKDGLAALTDAAKKEASNNRIKALESRLQFKDVTATVYTSVALSVSAPPQKTP
jgi:hypothetical protein